ncbi:hypothetical protein EW146_g1771, partial [Bondarzewia mesenterica]
VMDPALLASVENRLAEYDKALSTSAYVAASSLHRGAQTHALDALIRAAKVEEQVETLASDSAKMMQTIKIRAAPEPRTGKCDAILVTPILDVSGERIGSSTVQESLPENFVFVQRAKDSGNGGRATASVSDPNPEASLAQPLSAVNWESSEKTVDEQRYFSDISQCSDFYVKSTLTLTSGASLTQAPLINSQALLLPTLIVEYKKQDSMIEPKHQGRMNLVSAVTFLAAIGITDYPVFGLIADDAEGVVTAAWYSETQDKIYIIERNVCKFILTNPLEVFYFATFLVRLRKYNEHLKELFERQRAMFLGKAKAGTLRRWSKEAQAAELQQLQVTPTCLTPDINDTVPTLSSNDYELGIRTGNKSHEESIKSAFHQPDQCSSVNCIP